MGDKGFIERMFGGCGNISKHMLNQLLSYQSEEQYEKRQTNG